MTEKTADKAKTPKTATVVPETAAHTAQQVAEQTTYAVKTMSSMFGENMERMIAEGTKALDRTFDETEKMWAETQRLGDAQLRIGREMTEAWLEGARRMTGGMM